MANNSHRIDPKVKRIINEQSNKIGIDVLQGEEIWNLLGGFVKHIWKQGDYMDPTSFKSIYIKDLGTVYPNVPLAYAQRNKKLAYLKWLEENKDKGNQDESTE